MKKNVGGIDRPLRIIVGVALIAWALSGSGPAWAWIGVLPLLTGVLNFCPAYKLLGINTCKTQ
jgi:membrane-associated protease RseP (regulator of RpoE activity)